MLNLKKIAAVATLTLLTAAPALALTPAPVLPETPTAGWKLVPPWCPDPRVAGGLIACPPVCPEWQGTAYCLADHALERMLAEKLAKWGWKWGWKWVPVIPVVPIVPVVPVDPVDPWDPWGPIDPRAGMMEEMTRQGFAS